MALSPSSILSKPLIYLEDTLANCASFQTWVGAGDAATAKSSIHVYAVDAVALAITRPYVLIDHHERAAGESDIGGTRNFFLHRWELYLRFVAAVGATYQGDNKHRDAKLEFCNAVGAILNDLEVLAGTAGYLSIVRWESLGPPMRADSDDVVEGDFWVWQFVMEAVEP